MARTKKEIVEAPESAYTKFQAKLAKYSLGNALKLADDYSDIDVTFIPTGFPSLNLAINPDNGGMPKARHIEIFAKKESSGKTSLALAIAKDYQDRGLSVGIVDIEKTITGTYLKLHGIQTKPEEDLTKIPVTIMRSEINPDTDEKLDIYLEDILDTITSASNVYDLLIVDSVDALVTEEEAQKDATKNARVGGISMKLSQFFRKNTNTHACILWINQTRQSPGTYSPAGVVYVTSGGRALPFYASVRLELTVVEKLRENQDADPYGFVTKILVIKNKVGPALRIATLYYINGEGFSKSYDYFTLAIKKGLILKGGAGWYTWYKKSIKDPGMTKELLNAPENVILKLQGELKTYNAIKENPELLKLLLSKVEGEKIEIEKAPEGIKVDEALDYLDNPNQ